MARQIEFTRVVTHEITDAEYDLIRYMSESNKVAAIKFVRAQYDLGLKEAKDICDAVWGSAYATGRVCK